MATTQDEIRKLYDGMHLYGVYRNNDIEWYEHRIDAIDDLERTPGGELVLARLDIEDGDE